MNWILKFWVKDQGVEWRKREQNYQLLYTFSIFFFFLLFVVVVCYLFSQNALVWQGSKYATGFSWLSLIFSRFILV